MLFYLLLLMMSLNIWGWWWMWLVLELLNWIFILYIKSPFFILFYLMWQSLSSLIMLYSLVVLKSIGMICLMLLCKMSLPPFHMLFWNTHFNWSFKSVYLFLCAHKYPTILILNNFISLFMYYWMLTYPLIFMISFYYSSSIKSILWSILMSDSMWMLLSLLMNLNVFKFYLMYNLMLMFMLLSLINTNLVSNMMGKTGWLTLMILLFLNIPPFISFVLKWMIISEGSVFMSLAMMTSVCSVILLWNYLYFSIIMLNNPLWMSSQYLFWFSLSHLMWLMFI